MTSFSETWFFVSHCDGQIDDEMLCWATVFSRNISGEMAAGGDILQGQYWTEHGVEIELRPVFESDLGLPSIHTGAACNEFSLVTMIAVRGLPASCCNKFWLAPRRWTGAAIFECQLSLSSNLLEHHAAYLLSQMVRLVSSVHFPGFLGEPFLRAGTFSSSSIKEGDMLPFCVNGTSEFGLVLLGTRASQVEFSAKLYSPVINTEEAWAQGLELTGFAVARVGGVEVTVRSPVGVIRAVRIF
jgi:hypothetical protein